MDSTTRLRHRQVQVSYAWVIVGASFLTLMTTGGTRFGFGLFFKPIEESLGWDKTTLSIAVSINMIIYGVTLPMVGYLTDRHGPKRVILASLLLAGLGMMLLSQTRALWQLYLFYGVLVGIGTGGSAFVPISALIARWFVRRRSLGMGVAFAGASAGQLVMIPLTLLLLTTTNWHVAFLVLGLGLVVVVAPAVLILVRETPGTTAAAAESARSAFQATPSLSVRQALRTRTFWLLAGGFSTCGFSVTTISIHLPSYVDDLGLSQGVAAAALTVMGALSLTGSILAGLL
ncbi:MAG: MFS transporter, partial [Dehalococcoidia bacterium]